MMKAPVRTIAVLASFVVPLLSATAGNAQVLCGPRDTAVSQLESQYNERVVGRGLVDSSRGMVELFVSETGTWSVVVTDTNKRSCFLASGVSWTKAPLLVDDPS